MNLVTDSVANVTEPSSDEQLARRVKNFLQTKLVRGPLTIEVHRGEVLLRGRVGSFYHKQLLIHGAQRVAGVRRVIDDLNVIAQQVAERTLSLEPA